MPQEHVLSLRLALMGRPVRSYVFGKPVILVGRDPEADVFIDNPGVSREHIRLELNPEGEYEVVDLGSANDLTATWNSEAIAAFRRAHIEGPLPEVCRGCYYRDEHAKAVN